MPEPTVRHHYVNINNSIVHLVQYGHGNESIVKSASPTSGGAHKPGALTDKLIVFIPGNPGLLGMYHDFLVELYKTIARPSDKAKEPVLLAIGHNNFHTLDYEECSDQQQQQQQEQHENRQRHCEGESICIEESDHTFGANNDPNQIELQCLNKLIILKYLLRINLTTDERHQDEVSKTDNDGGCRIVFVGHSVGCYVILKLLQEQSLAAAHAGSILVHPALENLATTKKGAFFDNFFGLKLDLLLRLLALGAETLLPRPVILDLTKALTCSHEFASQASKTVLGSVAQIVHSSTLNALIGMAKSELDEIKDLDHNKLIAPHVNKLRLIYALDDHWVNDTHRLELAQLYPELQIEEQQTMHAFIMDPSAVDNYSMKLGMLIETFFERPQEAK